MAEIKVTINGRECTAESGMTILEAAKKNNIRIPTLCHFEGLTGRANCRMCIVEVEGMRVSQPACVTAVRDGMVINTETEKLQAARKANLELIMAHHAVDCHHCLRIGSSSEQSLDPKYCEMCFWCDCERDGFCELQALTREYHVDVLPYVQHEHDYEIDSSTGSIIRNPNKCIKCRRCVDVCGQVQSVHNLSMANRGCDIMVVPEMGRPMAESACVKCGHCVDVCPTGAIYMKEHINEMLYMSHSPEKDVIAQLSDNVLDELTSLYKLKKGEIRMEQIVAALHKVGVKTVVSDEHARSVSANQAKAIIDENIGKAPLMITDSSAVMNFVNRYFPEMKEKIHVYDSPQTVFCKSAAEYAAGKPLRLVSITNVKEAGAEAKDTGNCDYVMNARELYRMFLRTGGAPHRRTAHDFDCTWEKETIPYETLLGVKDWNLGTEAEETAILVNGKPYKCAIAHNLGQVRSLLSGKYGEYDVIRLTA